MMHIFYKKGYDPVPGWNFPEQFDRCMTGPNIHLKGVALRINAEKKIKQNNDKDQILPDLQESEAYLIQSGDPTELAKTRTLLYKLTEPSTSRDMAGEDFSEKFLQLLEAFHPPWEPDEGLDLMVRLSNHVLGAERGAFFVFKNNQSSLTPKLKTACNLSAVETGHPDFDIIMEQIKKSFQENRILVLRPDQVPPLPQDQDIRVRSMLCIPIDISPGIKGLLFHSNTYLEDKFSHLDDETLMRFSRYIGDSIKFFKNRGEAAGTPFYTTHSHDHDGGDRILTRDSAMELIILQTETIARSDSSVLILGDTGTGKELFADKIHKSSLRVLSLPSNGPFVVVDATAIPENLVESHLFGHEKGSFTGADQMKKGQIELAHKGTLFFDEIGELPLQTQAKLLRALEGKSFQRVGGSRPKYSDFRLVAATNRDLAKEVIAGRFRQDLFFRLNVVAIRLPPLKKRGKDVLFLANHFLKIYTRRYNKGKIVISPRDENRLLDYSWPGNVRELKNIMERAAILSSGDQLDLDLSTGHSIGQGLPGMEDYTDILTMDEMQREYIEKVMKRTKGRLSGPKGAATLLGMKTTTLFSRMKKLGLR